MQEKFTPTQRSLDPVVDDTSLVLTTSSLPVYSSIPQELLALVTSPRPEDRLIGVEQLASYSGDGDATKLLHDCLWDPDQTVRDAVERALGQVESEGIGQKETIQELRDDLNRLSTLSHALRRGELIQELAKDAGFLTNEFQEAIAGRDASLITTLLRIERDTRVLYSAIDLDRNFPEGWLDDQQDAIDSLILSMPKAQEVLLNSLGGELGGVFAAQALAAVLMKDYERGEPLDLDPLRDLLCSDDPRAQFQALTTIEHLGEYAQILLPDIAQLLQPSEAVSEPFRDLEFDGEEYSDAPDEDNLQKESSSEQERNLHASVRGVIRSIVGEIMDELKIPAAERYGFDVSFSPDAEMGEAAGLALPSMLVISDQFLPVLEKILDNEPLDHKEFFRGLSALTTILHEGRHLAQFRVVPFDASAAYAQEILRPRLNHLEPDKRSDVFDGARASALDIAAAYELGERGEAVPLFPNERYEEKLPLSLELLRAAYVLEVDAYCYEAIKVWEYVDRFPSLRDAAVKYAGMEPPRDNEFYGEESVTEQERKEMFREIMRVREGDEMAFSYFRKF